MPQLTVELSWFEFGRFVLWCCTMIVSFRLGQWHGARSSVPCLPGSVSGEAEMSVDTPGPSKARGSGDETPSVRSGLHGEEIPSEVASSSENAFWPPEILMVEGGQAMHLDRGCYYLKNSRPKPMRWCSKCGAYAAHRRWKAE